jgi:serine/threonine protein kinase
MPVMEGDMEKFFFGEKTYFQKNPGVFTDTVEFRITMSFKMTQALKNIHEMGFINKDLKPENFLYKVHETTGNLYNIVLSIADFGLAGIDDYNTYQYSDLSYRPFDNYTLMSKELDVYQLGVSMFQLLFNIPRQHKPGLMSLNLLNYFIVPETMAKMLRGPALNDWSIIQGIGLNYKKINCVKELVTRLYEQLLEYTYPNREWKYSFSYFFYEMKNVQSYMSHSDNFIKVTSQNGFKIAVRSYFLANFMAVESCHQYQDVTNIFGYYVRQAIHPDPTIRASSLSLFEDMKYEMKNLYSKSGVDIEYSNYNYERLLI